MLPPGVGSNKREGSAGMIANRTMARALLAAGGLVVAACACAQAPASAAGQTAPGDSQARPAAINLHGDCLPSYPSAAERARVKGVTRVKFTIDATGAITAVEVIHRSGPLPEHRLLDSAAVEALSRCPIRVGRDENGRPVGGEIVATYNWQ